MITPTQKITYADLAKRVNKFANGLKSLGVVKGDRVSIYMPMIPETPIAMLACAKIGAIHSVVFSGFSSGGLNSRVLDLQESKVVITTDGFYRRGKPLPLKPNVDEATANTPSVRYFSSGEESRHRSTHESRQGYLVPRAGFQQSDVCESEKMDGEDRLVYPLHLRHNRQAQGYSTRSWRLLRNSRSDTSPRVFDVKDADAGGAQQMLDGFLATAMWSMDHSASVLPA